MNKKIIPVLLILLFGLTALAFAQQPAVIVEYYENTSGAMYVRTSDGAEYSVDQFGFGEELPVGATLITLDADYAELRMDPNGTIIRVGENTNFRVDGLQGRGGAQRNNFSVAVGKFKAVVAKRDGAQYSFRGATAVMGIRGTTVIGYSMPGGQEIAYVLEGVAEYTNAAGQKLTLTAGQAADALAANFTQFNPTGGLRQLLESGMDFVRLLEQDVPGSREPADDDGTDGEEQLEEGEEEKDGPDDKEGTVEQQEEVSKTEGQSEDQPEEQPEAETPKWLEALMTYLGVELGTTTIASETWAKAIIQPKFAFGKLKLALYLPVIYKEDMLDPSTWYKPEGNDEWSFGTDQSGWDEIALDALNDLFLKIRYIQWGNNRDPFFFKFGNIDNFGLGHGSIMRNYANDSNFPNERKIGLQLGVNRETGGLELMVNDAADPEVFGFRAHTRPFAPNAKLGIGLSAMADINPDRGASLGNPIFLNAGIDLDQPIVESEGLSIILFADATTMIPYYREDPGFGSGFQLDAIWYDGKPKNWGLDTGVFGELLILDYRLELLVSNGLGQTPFYGPLYDENSADKVTALNLYLSDPSLNANDPNRIGVRGEVGYTLDKVFYITGGYNWNWAINPVAGEYVDDEFWMEFGLFEELLPVYGSIGLRRIGLVAPWVNGDSISFFDENLVLSGALVYPLSPIMELALEVKSNVIGGKWYPTWSVLTRLN